MTLKCSLRRARPWSSYYGSRKEKRGPVTLGLSGSLSGQTLNQDTESLTLVVGDPHLPSNGGSHYAKGFPSARPPFHPETPQADWRTPREDHSRNLRDHFKLTRCLKEG